MRLLSLSVLLLLAVAFVAAQWSNTDYEIFELQAALEKDEGPGSNFYSILNLTKGASATEIRKAYRARSMEMHPDKHPNNPSATKRFERLGVIIKILRDERRDRYDHFLMNGFPRWRGTGYYYARFRPGLGTVIFFLIAVTSAIQLLIMNLNYKRDRKRLVNLQTSAKLVAWGPRFRSIESGLKNDNLATYNKNIIIPSEKKVRVPLSGFDVPPLVDLREGEDEKAHWDADEKLVRKVMAKGVSAEQDGLRRFIDALVTKDCVFVMTPDSKEWSPLDEDAAPKPSARDTWPVALASSALAKLGLRQGTPIMNGVTDHNNSRDSTTSVTALGSSKKKSKKRQ